MKNCDLVEKNTNIYITERKKETKTNKIIAIGF